MGCWFNRNDASCVPEYELIQAWNMEYGINILWHTRSCTMFRVLSIVVVQGSHRISYDMFNVFPCIQLELLMLLDCPLATELYLY